MPSHSRTTSSYGYRHRKIRAALIPAAIGTPCPGDTIGDQPYRSPKCDRIMTDPARMHLAHAVARVLGGEDGSFINCAPCNLSAGAMLGNRLRPQQQRGTIPARTCNACGDTYQPNHHKQHACSQQCRRLLEQRRAARLTSTPRTAPPDEQRQCSECNATFWAKHTRRLTCSDPCAKTRAARRRRSTPDLIEAARDANTRYRARQRTRTW